MTGSRQAGNFAVCFTRGTRLLTPRGYVPIEELCPGDLLTTVDNGSSPVEWIGSTQMATGDTLDAYNMRPIRVRRGHHGLTRDIMVSPQHCVAVGDNFVRARHLAEIPGAGARVAYGVARVEYFHVLCARHEVLIAEGMQTESFYPGPQAMGALGSQAFAELERILPDLSGGGSSAALASIGPTARPILRRRDVRCVSHHEDLVAIA